MKRRTFYTEAAYLLGLLLLALGTALTAKGGFGISMVVAPAYILHLHMAESLDWFSFGVAEYVLQALLLVVLVLALRRFKRSFLLSFLSTLLYGFALDGAMHLVEVLGASGLWARLGLYSFGVLLCTAAIALLFRSYLPPAAYELLVKELAAAKGWSLTACKTVYDCTSLVLAAIMSLLFFGDIRGIGVGTVVCALIYGMLIKLFGRLLDRLFVFTDRLQKVRNFI